MKDTLQRFIFDKTHVRGELIRLDDSLSTILKQHQYPSEIKDLLAQSVCAAALLSSTLKYEGELTIQFQSDEALEMLVAKCDDQYRIRATGKWDADNLGKKATEIFGKGQLVITINDKKTNRRYQSIVELQHNSIAKALETYFTQSEQLQTRLWLDNQGDYAVGLLLQKLPEETCSESDQDMWQHVQILADTLKPGELLTWDNKTMLHKLFFEDDIVLFDPYPVTFYCPCGPEKMLNAIVMLGEEEAMDILKTNRFIDVTCDYCNNHFEFSKEEVARLFTKH